MATNQQKRILVTGGSTFLGLSIAAALLAEGADVTVLVRPQTEDRLGVLANRVRWYSADVWDSASLRGRARGHQVVIHTVGSMVDDPAHGLTYHRLNVVSARNVANMCIGDGVPHMILLSGVSAPWVSRRYIAAKREAESYLRRVGLPHSIIRAPLVYVRGQPRPLFYRLMTLLGTVPPVSWLWMRRIAPMPLDWFARGVARVALEPTNKRILYYAPHLRQRVRRRDFGSVQADVLQDALTTAQPDTETSPFMLMDENAPFGWSPNTRK